MGGEGSQCPADRQIGRAFKYSGVEPTLAAAVLDKTGLCIPPRNTGFESAPLPTAAGRFTYVASFRTLDCAFRNPLPWQPEANRLPCSSSLVVLWTGVEPYAYASLRQTKD